MAKVFTITEGLENLGALKSGGQGSVYKARRNGEIITAIKILPTPISSETDDDKNFMSFQNEVHKLKKVNENPNPNVVSIIASGITSSGNLPYIEMEYIEGPDLAELLKPPYDPVFTIKETLKVADHLSNALAHCHGANIKHGDIKSNNVKFNQRTGNYILLDFGLSIMSDEQRRTSIRHAGAIEFMAPEQSAGETLFETDIYSFGVILFELLSGTVPFPLHNKGEMARNSVMIAHMEAPVPDLLSLRRHALPDTWSHEKKERQMQVPSWLIEMIYKCLEKSPSKRFSNGNELQEFIHSGIIAEESKKFINTSVNQSASAFVDELNYKKQLEKLELRFIEKDNLINDLQEQVDNRDKELYQLRYAENDNLPKQEGISKAGFFIVLVIAIGLSGFNIYNYLIKPYQNNIPDTTTQVSNKMTETIDSSLIQKNKPVKKIKTRIKKVNNIGSGKEDGAEYANVSFNSTAAADNHNLIAPAKYRIINTAYFYDRPDETGWRNEYLADHSTVFTALQEKGDFIFIKFLNSEGQVTKGWLLKKKLSRVY